MFDLDDPKKLALLMAGLGLMGGAPGQRRNFGADLAHGGLMGIQGYQGARAMNARDQEEAQQRQMREMQMDEMRRAAGERSAMQAAAQRNFVPGQPQMLPTDMETPSGPAGPSSFNFAGYMRDIAPTNPLGALQLQSQLASLQAKDRVKLGKGEALSERQSDGNYRTVARGAPDLPQGMEEGPNGPRYMPAYIEGQEQIARARRPQTTVNLPPAQKAFEVELAKLDAKQLDEWRDVAVKATGGLSRIGEMKRLAQEGVYSGWAASGRSGVANFFNTVGLPMDPKKLENSQEYMKHAKELTLSMLKEGVGATNISNADLQFVNETVPQLETNPQARMNLLNYMEQRLGQSVERFNQADAHARERGGLSGFGVTPQKQPKLQKNLTATVRAKDAIKRGADPEAVRRRLREQGYDDSGL